MFNGKMKAITFSYDDGVFQDRRLVEIFNKYGLKCTFNVNSGLFGKGSRTVMPEEMPELYKGHEVAVHCITHPQLSKLESDEEIINEVEGDRKRLCEIMGYEVVGMAYPYGDYDDRVVDIIKKHTGVLYSRGVPQSLSFDMPSELLTLSPTCHHACDQLFELAEKFIALKPDSPKMFYIWGHSYEFDQVEGAWERFERFCELISGHDDIFYGTNKEVLIQK